MKKRTLLIVISLLVFALYSIIWVLAARYIEKSLKQTAVLAEKNTTLSGYPLDIKFTINNGDNEPTPHSINNISFNLFSRKIVVNINMPTSFITPKILPSEEFKLGISNYSAYFKLDSYFKAITYLQKIDKPLDLIDLFNLTQKIGVEMQISIDDKKRLVRSDQHVAFDVALSCKRTYQDFNELGSDIPHCLSVNMQSTVSKSTNLDNKTPASFMQKLDSFIHPASYNMNITAHLPDDQIFNAMEFEKIFKNLEMNLGLSRATPLNTAQASAALNNLEDIMKIKADMSSFYTKKQLNLANKAFSREELLELSKYMLSMYKINLTENAEQKFAILLEAPFAIPKEAESDVEAKMNIIATIPHNTNSGKNANYALHLENNTNTFVVELVGSAGAPQSTQGVLSITDKDNVVGQMLELKDLVILIAADDVSVDVFKKRVGDFERNSVLLSNMVRSFSDDSQATDGDIKYTYEIDFQLPDIMKSKISKNSTLEDFTKGLNDIALDLGK